MHGAIVAGEVGLHARDETGPNAGTLIPAIGMDAVGERYSIRVAARAPIATGTVGAVFDCDG